MDWLIPHDCAIDQVTPYWLLLTVAGLNLACIALLVQAVVIWRREVDWWRRIPLALWVLVSLVCGLLATQAWSFFRDVTTPSSDPYGVMGICIPIAQTYSVARILVLVAAIMVAFGWFVLRRIARQRQRVSG